MNFWENCKKPIMILAPMEGVTDTVFRQIVASVGKPDLFFTEFVPVDALLSKGKERVEKSLMFTEAERPIIAQIWGTDPEKFYQVARMLKKMGFDGIDINMGCPSGDIIKKGTCAALINNPKLATQIILSTIKGAESAGRRIPVSVKTRIGFNKLDTENWVRTLLQTPIAALILHLRTVAEMSKVPAHWEEISKAVKIRDELKSNAVIIGNGDIKTLKEAQDKCREYGIDGVMVGRGIFENVYLFNPKIDIKNVTPKQKISLLLTHLKLFEKTWKNTKNFESMKKFVKCYVNNFKGATEKRKLLMRSKNIEELILLIKD